jgi:hypothetical protein
MQLYGELQHANIYISFSGDDSGYRVLLTKNTFIEKSELVQDFREAARLFHKWIRKVLNDVKVGEVMDGGITC